MDGYSSMGDLVSCPHCGAEMRKGMVRCRECGKSAKEETGGDFELSGHVLVASQEPKCPRCGSTLDPAVSDCPVCASQMLDQLMSAPVSAPVPATYVPAPHLSSERPMSIMEQRVRQAAQAAVQERETAAEFETVAGNSTSRLRPDPLVTAKGASVTQPSTNPARSSVKAPPRSERPAPPAEAPAASPKPAAAAATKAAADEEEAPAPTVETSPACAALLASLAAADATLRCEIATALGKLGDKAAVEPLERHMGDKDIRVRRAVAAALIQLGHPKGETLLDIAQRMPASSVLQLAKPPAKLKKKGGGGGGGMNLDPKMLKVGGGVLVAAILGGGIWMWMNSTPSRPKKKGKAATTQKADVKKGKGKTK